MATVALAVLVLAFLVAVGRPPGGAAPLTVRDLPRAVVTGVLRFSRLAERGRRRPSDRPGGVCDA